MSLLQREAQAQQRAQIAAPPVAHPRVAVPVGPGRPAALTGREKLLHELRLGLQDEMVGAFDSLLDVADPAEVRRRVEGLVDRFIAAHAFGVTGPERLR